MYELADGFKEVARRPADNAPTGAGHHDSAEPGPAHPSVSDRAMMRTWLPGRPPWRGRSSDSSPPVAGGTLLRCADRTSPGRGAPPRRPGRSPAAGLLLLAALVLPLAGLFAPDAQAQTTRVLVSNIGESGNNSFGRQSQPFTTGGNTAGYGLTSVERIIQTVHATNGILVRIAPSLSGGGPDLSNSDVVTLTNPGTITPSATTTNTFSAPADTVLAANTTYHVVVTGADGTAETYTNRTASDAEDSGAASGWSIGNERYFSNPGSTSWFRSGSLRLNIRINGTIRTGTVADTTAPRVTSIERSTPTTSPTNADTLTWRVTFNEDVKDVGGADFAIAGTTETLTLSASAVSGSASQYDVTVSGAALADLDATLTLSFASGQNIQDLASNDLTNTTPTGTNESSVVVDNTAPTVTSIERVTPTTSPTHVNSLSWQVTFSEALPFTSPGPGTDDFVVSGTTGSFFIQPGSSTEFIVGVSGGDLDDLNDTVTLSFATGQNITDPAGNALVNVTPTSGTNDNFFVVDNTAPTVEKIERGSPTTSPTNQNDLQWLVTFSEPVLHSTVGFADFMVAGTTGSLANPIIIGWPPPQSSYSVPMAGGDLDDLNDTVTLTFAATQDITDLAGNALDTTGRRRRTTTSS